MGAMQPVFCRTGERHNILAIVILMTILIFPFYVYRELSQPFIKSVNIYAPMRDVVVLMQEWDRTMWNILESQRIGVEQNESVFLVAYLNQVI